MEIAPSAQVLGQVPLLEDMPLDTVEDEARHGKVDERGDDGPREVSPEPPPEPLVAGDRQVPERVQPPRRWEGEGDRVRDEREEDDREHAAGPDVEGELADVLDEPRVAGVHVESGEDHPDARERDHHEDEQERESDRVGHGRWPSRDNHDHHVDDRPAEQTGDHVPKHAAYHDVQVRGRRLDRRLERTRTPGPCRSPTRSRRGSGPTCSSCRPRGSRT